MIKKLYDFRQVSVPAPLLQAEVTREEMDAELALVAARFTEIVAVSGPVEAGDVVVLRYADEKGEHRIYSKPISNSKDSSKITWVSDCV